MDERKRLIYAVEDDEGIGELYQGALEDDYDVEVFPDGKSFLAAFSSRKPDLVILDIMLPDMDGYSILVRIRENDEKLPVIVVDDASDAESARELDRLAALHPEMTLLRHEVNRGKGGAFLTGLEHAVSEGYTHALQVDSDGQHDLADAPALLESARRHPGVLWSARPEYDESVPKKRLIGRYVTHVWVWIETLSFEIVDSMCGYRVYPVADTLAVIKSRPVGLFMDFDTEIMVRLDWRSLPVRFIRSRVIYPEGGRSNFRMWEDNVRISKMHARLFIESPLWWPARIRRLFRREPV